MGSTSVIFSCVTSDKLYDLSGLEFPGPYNGDNTSQADARIDELTHRNGFEQFLAQSESSASILGNL